VRYEPVAPGTPPVRPLKEAMTQVVSNRRLLRMDIPAPVIAWAKKVGVWAEKPTLRLFHDMVPP
jgi:hypothetical protein